ncbi:MAG TPA: hypothetical protein VFB25_11565 [Gaiellaceae bacterium]|nr:hypothetical protein [Gaiellaceae bacterium]
MVDPARVRIAVTLESTPVHTRDVISLFTSLEELGGRLAHAQKAAYMIEPCRSDLVSVLEGIGVEVVPSPVFDERCRYANKLAMFDPSRDYDYLVALDTDMVIGRDFSPFILGEAVAARVAGTPHLALDEWRTLFDHVGLPFPQARMLAQRAWEETIPYYATGHVILPHAAVAPLVAAWGESVRTILSLLDVFPFLARTHPHFTDQIGFAMALARTGLPHRELPLSLSFGYQATHPDATEAGSLDAHVLHTSRRYDRHGFLTPGLFARTNRTLLDVNEALRRTQRNVMIA